MVTRVSSALLLRFDFERQALARLYLTSQIPGQHESALASCLAASTAKTPLVELDVYLLTCVGRILGNYTSPDTGRSTLSRKESFWICVWTTSRE